MPASDRGPTGVGIGILAAEGDADFQIRVRAVGHQVGQAGRLQFLQVTDAGAGRGAAGEERQEEQTAQAAKWARQFSYKLGNFHCPTAPGTPNLGNYIQSHLSGGSVKTRTPNQNPPSTIYNRSPRGGRLLLLLHIPEFMCHNRSQNPSSRRVPNRPPFEQSNAGQLSW